MSFNQFYLTIGLTYAVIDQKDHGKGNWLVVLQTGALKKLKTLFYKKEKFEK